MSEENVLLVSCERALKEGLGETEVLKLRISEGSSAEHALGNGDVVAAKEGFVAGSAGGLGTGFKWAANGFAIGGIEVVSADGTSWVGHNSFRIRSTGM